MSTPKRPYFFQPDEFFNFGLAGEHPVTFLAWIDDSEHGKEPSVSILKVFVTPTFQSETKEWDITNAIKIYPARQERYEEEIRKDFLKQKHKDYGEELGA